ncbi:MAG: ATP-dependent helicase [uncultured Frankineae bacterium]|uniref:ATP-dependent helicase n=1 Tax=uncultured Frankineae bacterium TaxID=437475 RepID=A0A6J4LYD2_9ACTN|nr:MAG: ATP-dependent helicase [uncultured Frankineae bacterium]
MSSRPESLLARLLLDSSRSERVTHVEHVPARSGRRADWPAWADPLLVERLRGTGIERPWEHQVQAAELAHGGSSVVLATGTASGKSLAYLLPVLTALLADDRAGALYLSPTKALATDQLRAVRALNLMAVRAATYDGDTPWDERDWVRRHGRLVLTNPDMLHRGILPRHGDWASFLRQLRYVVVDECHTYRGVFGSHVALVLRRLRRVCARYGAHPVFVLASATARDPEVAASRLTGLPVVPVTDDASPRGSTEFALWEPPLQLGGAPSRAAGGVAGRGAVGDPGGVASAGGGPGGSGEHGAPVRRSATAETADLLADLVVEGARTIAFVRSRRGAESVALSARRALHEAAPPLVERVAAYRAGYLPEERRLLEKRLQSGDLLGVAATNALELGLDVSGLDAVVLTGWPGTVASVWQQAGRAGRAGQGALAVFVARDDPLDTYLVHHPQALFGRPVEATVLDPGNPYVLGPQLCCAAVELPLTEADLPLFGDPEAVRLLLGDLVRRGTLRARPKGWFWTSGDRPEVDIRGTGGPPVRLVEAGTGRLLGTVDAAASHTQAHTGAVYLHQGESWVVDHLDLEESVALVHAEEPEHTTSAREVTDIAIVESLRTAAYDQVELVFGTVDVTHQVVSYLKKRVGSGEVLGEEPLDLPPRQLRTRAVWYTVDLARLEAAGIGWADVPGAAHAAEHAAIGLLPLFATCDRWDIGGVSTALHPDTGTCTVFVYDGHPGGAGFAEQGWVRGADWLRATREAIAACECPSGCPSCVQSPKCGNGNEPLDKARAVTFLDVVLASGLAEVARG